MEPEPLLFYSIDCLLVITELGLSFWMGLLVLLLLIFSSAMVSGSEVAFFSITPSMRQNLEQEESDRTTKRILKLLDEPAYLLATILIANNIINIAIILLSTFLLGLLFGTEMDGTFIYNIAPDFWFSISITVEEIGKGLKFIIDTLLVTFLLVLFGEVSPKVYAKTYSMEMSRRMAIPISILRKAFGAPSKLLVNSSKRLEARLSKNAQNNSRSIDEIDQAIELTRVHTDVSEDEADILRGIINFNNISAKQIMCARLDVVAVDFQASYATLMDIILKSGYSRLPVIQDDFDHIMGLFYVKDLMPYIDNTTEDFEWQPLVRTDVLYVHENKKINKILVDFQKQKLHMAIVVDEFGGSSGIITLEDIMEQVIGDIKDEFDVEDVEYQKIDDYTYLFEGKTLLNDLCRVVDISFDTFKDIQGDSDTIAGLMLEWLGALPKKKEEFEYQHFKFKVTKFNERRIEEVEFKILD